MKNIICAFALLLALTAQCTAATPLFSTGPAPVQSFHTVQSHAAATTPSAHSTQAAPVTTSVDLDNGAAILTHNPAQPVATENESDSATRMQNLTNAYQAMGGSIRAINQNVAVLQQQMMEMQSARSQNQAMNWFGQIIQNRDFITFLCFGGVSVLLLGLGVLIGQKFAKKTESAILLAQKRVKADVLEDDTKSEYDFMSSDEAIPAKLDLARAYIAMNDDEQARMVLKTIVEKGNQEQRAEALSLIQSMLNK